MEEAMVVAMVVVTVAAAMAISVAAAMAISAAAGMAISVAEAMAISVAEAMASVTRILAADTTAAGSRDFMPHAADLPAIIPLLGAAANTSVRSATHNRDRGMSATR
jgi:hypothetical protein